MNMRIAILCNDRLALPAINALLSSGRVVAVAMADKTSETHLLVQRLCRDTNTPFQLFRKNDFGRALILWLHAFHPDVVLVKTFPWKIPLAALSLPEHGFINFHYAPLPAWRGPNPLFWMIRNRAQVAGISVHRMDEHYDTGPLLLQLPVPLQADISFGILYTQLAYAGVNATSILLQQLATGTARAVPQDHRKAKWYPRPAAADLMIDWHTMPAASILSLVKACNPWNKGAATTWKGWTFGITEAALWAADQHIQDTAAGTIVALDAEQGLIIACADGRLIRVGVIYTEEGFFEGHQLALFGIRQYEQLGTAAPVPLEAVPEEVSLL